MRTPKFQLGQQVTLKNSAAGIFHVVAIIHVTRIDDIETLEYQLRNTGTLQLAQAFEQELTIHTYSGNGFPPDWFEKNNPPSHLGGKPSLSGGKPPPLDKKAEDLMNMIRQANTAPGGKGQANALAPQEKDIVTSEPRVPYMVGEKSEDSNILEFKPSDSCKVGKEVDDTHKNFDYE